MRWISNAADSTSAEIFVYDEIGFWGTTADGFRRELQAIGNKPITVRINSLGGSVFDAAAIYTLLSERRDVTTQVDGVAASAASVIALAGKNRRMSQGGVLMVHMPSVVVDGDSSEIRKALGALDAVTETLISVYSKQTGNSREQVIAWMDGETWFTADQAKQHNFINEITAEKPITAKLDLSRFKNAPAALLDDYRGRATNQINGTTETDFMATLKEFLSSLTAKPGPTDREKFAVASIEKLGLKFDELFETKDEAGLAVLVEAHAGTRIAELEKSAKERDLKIAAALKTAGLDFGPDQIEKLGEAIDARIKTAASKGAVEIAASRGIQPIPHATTVQVQPQTATEKAVEWRKSQGLPV